MSQPRFHSNSVQGVVFARYLLMLCCLMWCLLAYQHPAYSQQQSYDAKPDATPQERALELTAQAVEKFNLGQFDSALPILNQSLKINEPVYETHYWLGRVFATKAGNSNPARQQAIKHFRRALELQPYGEQGDLSRGWLARFDGRPKRIIVSSVRHPILKTYDADSTEAVVKLILAKARDAQIATVSIRNSPIDLETQDAASLAKTCQNEHGELESGWLVGIAVESVNGSRSKGKIWIFDPLAKQLYPPTSVTTSLEWPKFRSAQAFTTGNTTLDSLCDKVWQRCRPIVGEDSNPKILDEVQFPISVNGVYARSAAPYEQALRLPVFMLAPVKTAEEEDEDTAREIGSRLQQSILEPQRISLISPGSSRQLLAASGIDFATATNSDWSRAGQEAKCRYVIVPTLSRFDLKTKTILFVTTVKAQVALRITVIDGETGKETSTKDYQKTASFTKVSLDELNGLLRKREEILNQVIQEASADVSKLIPTVDSQ